MAARMRQDVVVEELVDAALELAHAVVLDVRRPHEGFQEDAVEEELAGAAGLGPRGHAVEGGPRADVRDHALDAARGEDAAGDAAVLAHPQELPPAHAPLGLLDALGHVAVVAVRVAELRVVAKQKVGDRPQLLLPANLLGQNVVDGQLHGSALREGPVHGAVVLEAALKDRAVLKGEDPAAALDVVLPVPAVVRAGGVAERAHAVAHAVAELAHVAVALAQVVPEFRAQAPRTPAGGGGGGAPARAPSPARAPPPRAAPYTSVPQPVGRPLSHSPSYTWPESAHSIRPWPCLSPLCHSPT